MITVKNLSASYKNSDKEILKNISFNIQKGEIFGFLGPSGAGKSTTQRVITRILADYSGEVSVLGKDIRKWNIDFYNHIGVGFELPNHYMKLTALENLNYFLQFYSKRLAKPEELLEWVGLHEFRDKKTEEFSKGMKMRLNFIRALMHDPEVLFFDEPTTGLDPVNGQSIKKIIKEQKVAGKTIFLTTHNMHEAEELCDRVAFIVEGEIKLIDSPKKLKREFGHRLVKIETSNDHTNKFEFPLEDLGNNSDFLDILKKQEILSMHTDEASLDEIFIKVTGKSLV